MLPRNTNSLFTPAAYTMTEHMWQKAYVVKHRWKGPYQIFACIVEYSFQGSRWRWWWWWGGVWKDVNKATGRHVFADSAMGERSTSGDCSSATLLILAGCNLAWKVWPGKHGRGSWEREGETECWEDTDKACSKMKRGKRIWFRSVLEMCVCVCARACVRA